MTDTIIAILILLFPFYLLGWLFSFIALFAKHHKLRNILAILHGYSFVILLLCSVFEISKLVQPMFEILSIMNILAMLLFVYLSHLAKDLPRKTMRQILNEIIQNLKQLKIK